MTDQQKFLLKLVLVLTGSFSGWLASTFGNSWSMAALTPIAVAGLLAIVASVLGSVFGIVTPAVSQAVDVALVSGVHTRDEVKQIQRVTEPGTVPTPNEAAAILGKPQPRGNG